MECALLRIGSTVDAKPDSSELAEQMGAHRAAELMACCYRALGAFQAAFGHVGDALVRDQMRALMANHRATIDALRDIMAAHDDEPAWAEILSSVDSGKRTLRSTTSPREVFVLLPRRGNPGSGHPASATPAPRPVW